MIEAGLLVHGEDIAVPYDRFRDRVMFPIHDRGGRVIAFGGRALEPGAKAEIPEFAGDASSSTRARCCSTTTAPARPRTTRASVDRGRGLCRRHRDDAGRLSPDGRAARHGADGRAMRAAVDDGEEPILCFDGDKAGRKAAFRAHRDRAAADRPGQEPALRAAARGPGPRRSRPLRRRARRSPPCSARARPLAEMLFLRETEGQVVRHARSAAPASSAACANSSAAIGDETLRRHYRDGHGASGCAPCSAAQPRARPSGRRASGRAGAGPDASTPARASASREPADAASRGSPSRRARAAARDLHPRRS